MSERVIKKLVGFNELESGEFYFWNGDNTGMLAHNKLMKFASTGKCPYRDDSLAFSFHVLNILINEDGMFYFSMGNSTAITSYIDIKELTREKYKPFIHIKKYDEYNDDILTKEDEIHQAYIGEM